MAWDRIHKTVNANGGVSMTPGYLSETIALGDTADSSTSPLDYPTKSDYTVLVIFTVISSGNAATLGADAKIAVEHSVDGTTYIKQGQFEQGSISTSDISKEMHLLSVVDVSENVEGQGMMMMFDIDSHGMAPYTRFTVMNNTQDESANQATFYIIPHF